MIRFSRHARRRAGLYGIQESTVENLLKDMDFTEGEHEIVRDMPDFDCPLKIVIACENRVVTVVTNYPLKKGKKDEGSI